MLLHSKISSELSVCPVRQASCFYSVAIPVLAPTPLRAPACICPWSKGAASRVWSRDSGQSRGKPNTYFRFGSILGVVANHREASRKGKALQRRARTSISDRLEDSAMAPSKWHGRQKFSGFQLPDFGSKPVQVAWNVSQPRSQV